jgi:leukotriene-A4 hydrolase
MEGRWEAFGVNEHLLFAAYRAQGHFSPHTDGSTIVDFNTRSFYTVLVYLNTCADGGGTLMYDPALATDKSFVQDAHSRFRWKQQPVLGRCPCNAGTGSQAPARLRLAAAACCCCCCCCK